MLLPNDSSVSPARQAKGRLNQVTDGMRGDRLVNGSSIGPMVSPVLQARRNNAPMILLATRVAFESQRFESLTGQIHQLHLR